MPTSAIQASFNSGEWAPALNARVDLSKYHNGAALLRNFFVDYRGGASTRAGTKYVIQAYKSATDVRLITFQASFGVGYALEFGDYYIRFIINGSPVLETAKVLTGITKANPGVFTSVAHGFSVGEWVYVQSVVGMTQVNAHYYIINTVPSADTFTVTDLFGAVVNTTAYSTYTSGGTASRIYTLASPYAAADIDLIKFATNVSLMVLTHPSYVPYILTLISATNWTLTPILFGTSAGVPGGVGAATTLGAGTVNYSYVVTSVDNTGQESGPSTAVVLANKTDLRTVAGTNRITWTAVSGADSYNVYKAELSYTNAVATGAAYGYIGNATGVTFDDSNIAPDFDFSYPIPKNPFQGAGVESVTVTVAGAYTTAPTPTFAAAPAGGTTATGVSVLGVTVAAISAGGSSYAVGDLVSFGNGVILVVATVNFTKAVLTFQPLTYPGTNVGAIVGGSTPANPVFGTAGTAGGLGACSVNFTWGVVGVQIISEGAGYTSVPAITFSGGGAAAATAVLGDTSNGNPAVPGFFQQRLVLAALAQAPQSFFMSQPGAYYNFNITEPLQADDAISADLVSGQLNTIKSMVPMQAGLIMLSDKTSWLVNGGSAGSAIGADSIVANPQSYIGASDVPPIVANFDILFVQAKGSVIRDNAFNFYNSVFTGTDISVLSSHLFYGYTITEWAWAEEPFKVVWAVRDDGTLLSLTFLKEQELIGWAHSDTDGLFKSVCVVTETVDSGAVDAPYFVVERTISDHTVKYIERMAERIFPNGAEDAWCVDAGLQYDGTPATSFTGGEHLAGATVTGLADGVVIPSFVMAANGSFTLASAASKVTIGLAYTPQLQTLALDLGEPTVQGKRKQITAVTARVQETLGLWIGRTFSTLVAMKDLVVGNVGSASNTVVTDLTTADARTIIDASWTVDGQYCFEQPYPLPATILGVIPEVTVGDGYGAKK